MRIMRDDDPAKGGKQTQDLEAMDVSELQAKYKEVLGFETISRNKEVLKEQIRRRLFSKDIKEKRAQQKKAAGAKTEAETPTTTTRLTALTEMPLGALREEYEKVLGKASLSRNRKQLVKLIAERIQADAATTDASPEPALKPTLTVKFERKGGKNSGGKGKGRAKAKAAAEGKETAATGRTTRPAGQRDPRLPKPGTTIERVYKGKKLLVRVLEDSFEYDGKPYRSLSALAKKVTGQIVNGFVWWGLGLPGGEKKSS